MIPELIEKIEKAGLKAEKPNFRVGSSVRVHVKVREGGKERIQVFPGLVISRHGGGVAETFTVRRVSHGVGVERVFPLHSPNVTRIEVEKEGRVRRSKLHYLRGLSGKQSRLREEGGQETE